MAPPQAATGDVQVAVEGGAAWQIRNDFRIPGDGGSLVSLADFDSGPVPAFRATPSWYTFAFFHCAVAGVRIRF